MKLFDHLTSTSNETPRQLNPNIFAAMLIVWDLYSIISIDFMGTKPLFDSTLWVVVLLPNGIFMKLYMDFWSVVIVVFSFHARPDDQACKSTATQESCIPRVPINFNY